MTRKRAGFTFVELLTVTVLVGTLARISAPGVHDVLLDARAASVVGDIDVVRVAALGHQADHFTWPADAGPGDVPPGLAPYLPEAFDFQGPGYVLDWDVWPLPDGLPGAPGTRLLLAVTVVTEDRALGLAVAEAMGGGTHFSLGSRYTFLVETE